MREGASKVLAPARILFQHWRKAGRLAAAAAAPAAAVVVVMQVAGQGNSVESRAAAAVLAGNALCMLAVQRLQ
jgi:hypothetical protein